MLTSDIERLADFENVAAAGFPKGEYLRRKVIPDFYHEVGRVGWRRMTEVVTINPRARAVDISANFGMIESVWRDRQNQLKFIGDSKYRMMQAAAATDPAIPSEYFLGFNAPADYNDNTVVGQLNVRMLSVGAPTDGLYTLTVFGWNMPAFDDNTTAVDLDPLIPHQFQWGLVEGLRAEIFEFRLGVEDNRTMIARAKFMDYAKKAGNHREATIEETPRYA